MIVLERIEHHESGTPGRLYLPGGVEIYTLEDPWRENVPNVSCIPAGRYPIERDHAGRFRVWRIGNVPNRSAIEFHDGNTAEDTRGCVLLGLSLELFERAWRITPGKSDPGVQRLLERLAPYEQSGEDLLILPPRG